MNVLRLGLALLSAAAAAPAQDARAWEGLAKKAGFSLAAAIDRGVEAAGKGFPYHAELELDAGELVYSIDLWQGTGGVNVVLDAATGQVVEQVEEATDVAAAVAVCKVDLKRAIEAANAARQGVALEARLRLEDGKPTIEVRSLAGGALGTVLVDGATGEVAAADPAAPAAPAAAAAGEREFQSTFAVDEADLVPHGRNPFFVLEPGFEVVLEGTEGEDRLRVVISILDETRKIDGVECAVLEERESENGELAEVSRNFFAICKRSNAVYYFGEEVDDYQDGKVVAHRGAWQSGVDGARFGLFMPGTPLVGARFYNEHAPGVALDRVEIVSVTETVATPAGTFEGCVRWQETTPLEPGANDHKSFARGIGFVQDGPLELVGYGKRQR